MEVVALAASSLIPTAFSERTQRTVYWIDPPAKHDHKALADQLLRTQFRLSADEARVFIQRRSFFIADLSAPGKPATPAQIKGWKRDARGRVSVALSDYWVGEIRMFKAELVSVELDDVVAGIRDIYLRSLFAQLVLNLVTTPEAERKEAYRMLRKAVLDPKAARDEVLAAFDKLDAKERYARDPYLGMIRATVEADRAKKMYGPGYAESALARMGDAVRRVDEAGDRITRMEAAALNVDASALFISLGQEGAASEQDWIARFRSMPAEERSRYKEGSVISLMPPGRHKMSVRSPTEKRLDALDEERRRQLEMEVWVGGKPKNADKGDYWNQGNEFKQDGVVRRKKRGGGYRPKYAYGSTTTPLVNPQRRATIKGGAGAIELILLVFRFGAAHRRMNELADYNNKRDAIVRKIETRNFRLFPPRPEKFRAAILDLRTAESRAKNPTQRAQLEAARQRLEFLLRESEAAWPL